MRSRNPLNRLQLKRSSISSGRTLQRVLGGNFFRKAAEQAENSAAMREGKIPVFSFFFSPFAQGEKKKQTERNGLVMRSRPAAVLDNP
jgi:hypothetical protein